MPGNIQTSQIKILLLGFGGIGTRHANVLLKKYESFLAIVDPCIQEERLKQIAECKGRFEIFSSLGKINDIHEYDLAVIACNTHYHHDVLIELSSKKFTGKILVEKPLSAYPDKLKDLSFGSKQVMINYCRRYHVPYQRIKEHYKVSPDSIKSIVIACGCGGFFMLISHYLDIISFITGDFSIYPVYSNLRQLTYKNPRGSEFKDYAGTVLFHSQKSNLRIFVDCSNDLGIPPHLRFQGGREVIEFSEIDGLLTFYKRGDDVMNEPLSRYIHPLLKTEGEIDEIKLPFLIEKAYEDLMGSFSIGCTWEQGLTNANILLQALPLQEQKDLILA